MFYLKFTVYVKMPRPFWHCDSFFKGKKTCKEIGAQKAYNENLENDRLLKKWRTRYQTLAGLASKTKPGSKSKAPEMYEYYKREGAIMKEKYENGEITGKQFEEWIDCTKLNKWSELLIIHFIQKFLYFLLFF